MIDGKTVSAIMMTYHPKRALELHKTYEGLQHNDLDEVIIVDLGGHVTDCPDWIDYIRIPNNYRTRPDFAIAGMTDGDYVLLIDDDVMIKSGFAADMLRGVIETKSDIVGVIGRTFHGSQYYGDTKWFGSKKVTEPVRVGFAGVVYLARRGMYFFDTRGMPTNADDLWWEMKVYPDAVKHVIPTKNFVNLPTCNDSSAMYKTPRLRYQRQEFYQKWYERKF